MPDISRRTMAIATLSLAAGNIVLPRSAWAQEFPVRPIHIFVGQPAGSGSDVICRYFAEEVGKLSGQPMIVENKGGAGGNLAADYVARGPADGTMLLVAGQAILAINKPLYGKLPYEPENFGYIGMLGDNANVLLVNPQALPVASVAELIARAREKPGAISYGSNGVGSLSHLTSQVLANTAHVEFLHVPYQGAAPLATDLRAGRIQFCFTGSTLGVSLVESGGLRALAVTTPVRLPQLPDVPTLLELGYPDLDAPSWWAMMATPGTPELALATLRKAFEAATSTKAYADALRRQSTLPHHLAAKDAPAFLARERAKWAGAVKTSGAQHL